MRLLQSVNLISYFTSPTVKAQILLVKFSIRIGSNPEGAVEGGNHTASGQRNLKLIQKAMRMQREGASLSSEKRLTGPRAGGGGGDFFDRLARL